MKTNNSPTLADPPSDAPLNSLCPPLTADGVRFDFKLTLSRQTGIIINQWGRMDLPLLLNTGSLMVSAQTLSNLLEDSVVQHFKIELNQFFDKLAYEERRKEVAELQAASPSPASVGPVRIQMPAHQLSDYEHLQLMLAQQANDLKAAA